MVGGVGIMNIMYVVVTERTSEIGLKKSLGASSKDILAEFLTEAVLLTGIGGAVGCVLGAGAAFLVSFGAGLAGLTWKFAIPVPGLLISVGISAIVGLTFGVLPAYRASKMDPIEALRQE
jgi:putative ABC transport system permease protein